MGGPPSLNMNRHVFLLGGVDGGGVGVGGVVNICVCRPKWQFKGGRHCASLGLLFVGGQKVSEYYSLGLSFMNVSQSKQAL